MFTVIWSHRAFEQTDEMLKAQPERRKTIQQTLRTIADTLRENPLSAGEAREGNRRLWFIDYLIVEYDVDVEDETIEITRVLPAGLP
jgi:plasmid stabilization system protein ParE